MYESFYGFSTRPFLTVPAKDRYFPAESIETARTNLIRCLDRAEGCGLVMGPTGSGISMLCEVIAEHFRGNLATVLLGGLRLTNCHELLQAVLHALGQPHLRMTDGELRIAIADAVSPGGSCPQGIALIVDEAHRLPLRVLEELRFLTNFVHDAKPGVRLLLAGGSGLEERFADPRLAQMNQRVAVRCYLLSFTAEESFQFIRAQTASAGTDPDRLWAFDALKAIHRHADGLPRLINQLCNHALLLAAPEKVPQLTEREVERAWADMQQIPTASHTDPAPDAGESSSTVIEFASLDEETPDAADPSDVSAPPTEEADAAVEPLGTHPAVGQTLPVAESEPLPATQDGESGHETAEGDCPQSEISEHTLSHCIEVTPSTGEESATEVPTSSQTQSPGANRQPLPANTVLVTEYAGIDAGNVMPVKSARPEAATPSAEGHPAREASGPIENRADGPHDAPVDPQPPTVDSPAADDQKSASVPLAHETSNETAQETAQETAHQSQPSHPLIPLTPQTVHTLGAELQFANAAKNPALKHLVQP